MSTDAPNGVDKVFDVGEVEDGVDLGTFQKALAVAREAVEADDQL